MRAPLALAAFVAALARPAPARVQPRVDRHALAMAPSPLPRPSFLRGYGFTRELRHDPGLVPSPSLQSCVDAAVARLGLSARARAGELGLALADLTRHPRAPRFAGVNATRELYAASVPKIATLAAAFALRRAARDGVDLDARRRALFTGRGGAVDFTPAFREALRLSMYRSDNAAATLAAESVGYDLIAAFVWDTGLYDPREGGGLWIGLGFGRGTQRWRGDPLRELPHAATPLALARFYALLGQDRLVDAESSTEARELMGPSAFHNRFRLAVLTRYPGARVYRKTGTQPPWRHDSALVERPGARYAIAGLCRGDDCSQALVRVGEALDDCAGQ